MENYTIHHENCQLQIYTRGSVQSDIAVLFLHGGPGSGAAPIMELSAFQELEKSYFCIYFDQRGSGLSTYDVEKGLPLSLIIEDVHQVILDIKNRYASKHLYLWGGSFGGCLAALYCERYSDTIDSLVLSSPALLFSRDQAIAFLKKMQKQSSIRLPDSQDVLLQEECSPEELFQLPALRQLVFSPHNPSKSLRHITAMSSWFFQQNFTEFLSQLKVPTLILQGEEDPICSYENLSEGITKAKNPMICYHHYPSCGHEIFKSLPKIFVEVIQTFIEKEMK